MVGAPAKKNKFRYLPVVSPNHPEEPKKREFHSNIESFMFKIVFFFTAPTATVMRHI